MEVLSIQPTPNPNAFKFLLDATLLKEGSLQFASAPEAQKDPLATAIFAVPGVESVYFAENFATVSMLEGSDRRTLQDQVQTVLESHHVDAATAQRSADPVAAATAQADDPILLEQINEILDDRVRPALAGDGGGLEILGLENKSLRIRYQGACGSCPSSITGTLRAIENLLQTEVDEELQVLPG